MLLIASCWRNWTKASTLIRHLARAIIWIRPGAHGCWLDRLPVIQSIFSCVCMFLFSFFFLAWSNQEYYHYPKDWIIVLYSHLEIISHTWVDRDNTVAPAFRSFLGWSLFSFLRKYPPPFSRLMPYHTDTIFLWIPVPPFWFPVPYFPAFPSVLSLLPKITLPGQGRVLHDCVSSPFPTQSLPPWVGGGLSHFRDLLCIPPAQVTVHCPQGFHLDQFPSPATGDHTNK